MLFPRVPQLEGKKRERKEKEQKDKILKTELQYKKDKLAATKAIKITILIRKEENKCNTRRRKKT